MLALAAHRASLCPTCGGVLAETTAPENETRYKAELPIECFRCREFGYSHDAYRDMPQPHSFHHRVAPKPG